MSGEAAFDIPVAKIEPVAAPRIITTIAEMQNHFRQQHFIIGIVTDQLRMFLRGNASERPDAAETLLEIILGRSSLQGWVIVHVASAIVCLPEIHAWLRVPGYNLEKVVIGYLAYCAYCA